MEEALTVHVRERLHDLVEPVADAGLRVELVAVLQVLVEIPLHVFENEVELVVLADDLQAGAGGHESRGGRGQGLEVLARRDLLRRTSLSLTMLGWFSLRRSFTSRSCMHSSHDMNLRFIFLMAT